MPRAKFKGHPGQRVVEGQRMMQAASDVFLGWTQDPASGRHFYVRQLKNRRLGSVSELVEEQALVQLRTPVRTHARARACALADRGNSRRLHGQNGVLDDALASFAMAYAARTQSDYDRLLKAKRPAPKPADNGAKETLEDRCEEGA